MSIAFHSHSNLQIISADHTNSIPWTQFEACSCLSRSISPYKSFTPNCIKNIEFYPPATKVTFTDGTVTTAVARGEDDFDECTGVLHCIMEYIFNGKTYNNMIRKLIKKAKEEKAEKENAIKKAEEEKKIKERQRKKKAAKKLLKKQARMEEAIEIQKEAYLRAMEEKGEA